jgi:hypothetical protein
MTARPKPSRVFSVDDDDFSVEEDAAEKRERTRKLQRQRYQKTCEALKRWRTKLKRANNAVKKLEKRRRYYEKVLEDGKA